jgi:predicted DNA-binding protein
MVFSMVTSIQLSKELKQELSSLKKNETYEEVISKLLKQHKKSIIAEQMKEYGKKHGEKSLKELKEWETTDINWRGARDIFLAI